MLNMADNPATAVAVEDSGQVETPLEEWKRPSWEEVVTSTRQ